MLTLTEQYIIKEVKWELQDLYKSNKKRGSKWADKSTAKSVDKILGKVATGQYKTNKQINKDINSGDKKADRMNKLGTHIGQVGGVATAGALAGGAYLAYKLYKKWKNKEKEADTPEEKELFRKKAAAAKSKSQKLKAKKSVKESVQPEKIDSGCLKKCLQKHTRNAGSVDKANYGKKVADCHKKCVKKLKKV